MLVCQDREATGARAVVVCACDAIDSRPAVADVAVVHRTSTNRCAMHTRNGQRRASRHKLCTPFVDKESKVGALLSGLCAAGAAGAAENNTLDAFGNIPLHAGASAGSALSSELCGGTCTCSLWGSGRLWAGSESNSPERNQGVRGSSGGLLFVTGVCKVSEEFRENGAGVGAARPPL